MLGVSDIISSNTVMVSPSRSIQSGKETDPVMRDKGHSFVVEKSLILSSLFHLEDEGKSQVGLLDKWCISNNNQNPI